MITLKRTDSDDPDFISLVNLLDADLAARDGDDHAFYAQFNKISKIRHVVVAFYNGEAIGCGAIKRFSDDTAEVKRMYVLPTARNRGVASQILRELERWAKELSFNRCVLETGRRQPEAISLYVRSGYQRTANYAQYIGIENSLCFEKSI